MNSYDYGNVINTIESLTSNHEKRMKFNIFSITSIVIIIFTQMKYVYVTLSNIDTGLDKINIIILYFVVSYNILLSLFQSFNFIMRRRTIDKVSFDKYNYVDKKRMIIPHMIQVLFTFLALIGNMYLVIIFLKLSHYWGIVFILYLGIIFKIIINMIFVISRNYFGLDKRSKAANEYLENENLYVTYEKETKIFFICIHLILVVLTILYLYQSNFISANIDLIKTGIIITIVSMLLEYWGKYVADKILYSWLLDLGKDLRLGKIEVNQAVDELKNIYDSCIRLDIFYY